MTTNTPPLFAQIKLHTYFGGGEVFARQLAEAASSLGHRSVLVIHPGAGHWKSFVLPDVDTIEASTWEEAESRLPAGTPLIVHAAPPAELAQRIAKERMLIGFVHMPLNQFYADTRQSYTYCHRIVGVSNYVIDTIRSVGLDPWPEPFYGIADVNRLHSSHTSGQIVTASEFEWDRRKLRDRLLGLTEPVWDKLRHKEAFTRRKGLTLGIVSRFAPIKQFPLLMDLIAPEIAKFEGVNLEFFGAGGFASVRDLRKALQPISDRVRFWGFQPNVAEAYRNIDVLLTGLPEREALGLNVIEAQACGVPVLAPSAPPFSETIVPGSTGWLYADPRTKAANATAPTFREALESIIRDHAMGELPDPRRDVTHMNRFSAQAFSQRLNRLVHPESPPC